MVFTIDGHTYRATIASDLDRDGLSLEVEDSAGHMLAVIFYSDADHTMSFTAHRPDLPLALVEWMTACAKDRLISPERLGG